MLYIYTWSSEIHYIIKGLPWQKHNMLHRVNWGIYCKLFKSNSSSCNEVKYISLSKFYNDAEVHSGSLTIWRTKKHANLKKVLKNKYYLNKKSFEHGNLTCTLSSLNYGERFILNWMFCTDTYEIFINSFQKS